MQTYDVEVKLIDGTAVNIKVEAENEDDAYGKAMLITLRVNV